ncbi:aminotransferase class IV [Roseibacillus persicicus]|uniref:branched-chain-amino-acid transaminase n=1 Tax=Roseibacillus persicicus TaxID=454148 RepID=A0A918TFP7_9BACT|nr:aminotransferase class IV [Roseibacillus persicicus]GHC47166.1 branched chain amino acid aminotransferase [Roseibacillus persicicus]
MLQQYNPKNENLIVFINGKLVHRDEAGVSPFDSSVQNGDACWEGLRVYKGKIFKLEEHLDRLFKSMEMLRYEGLPTREEIISAIKETLAANEMFDNVHIRLTVSRGVKYTSGLDPRINTKGCSLFVLAEHKAPVYDTSGLFLATTKQRRPFADVLDQRIHSCNQLTSILAKLEATDAGADDALMLDTEGNLAETNATHVFLVKDGTVLTSTTKACPTGITRATVFSLCEENEIPLDIRGIPEAEIHTADEVFCTGTMGEIVAVNRIDDTIYNEGQPGPVTQRLAALYQNLTETEGYPIV